MKGVRRSHCGDQGLSGSLEKPSARAQHLGDGRTALLSPRGYNSSLLAKHHKVYLLQLIKVPGEGP